MTRTAIFAFEDAEELDFVGPWEVLTMTRMLEPEDEVFVVAPTKEPVRCAKGLRVLPDHDLASAPPCNVLLVPGGQGTRKLMTDATVLAWVRQRAAHCEWVTSVCTGSLVLAAAGLLDRRRATTHFLALDELRKFDTVTVVERLRYVRDGNVVTAAGVSAGIDMTLWLVGQLHSPDRARETQRLMQYDPAPPYTAEV